jgi:uncharacterized membrane protein
MTTQTPEKPSLITQNPVRTLGIVLAIAGLIDSIYLSWLHLGSGHAAFCETGGGCDIVQSSAWAEVGGIPVALIGLAGYIVILLALLLDKQLGEWGQTIVLGATMIGTLYSAFLTYVEVFILRAICPYCVASAVFMVGLLVVAIYQFRTSWLEPPA